VNGVCPFCKEAVVLKQTAKEGDLIVCQACDTELEIVSLKPVELDWPLDDYDMDEDFDDYEDDDYDDYDDDDYDDDWDDD
jgi:lysine biosynthesis protein LysW